MSSLSTDIIESTKRYVELAKSNLDSDEVKLPAHQEEALKKLEEVHELLSIKACQQCGMTNKDAREVVGMNDAGFDQHQKTCKFRDRAKDFELWRKKNPKAEEIRPTKKPKLNQKAYSFVANSRNIELTGARLEECKRLFEGTVYLDWISQSEEGEGTEEEDEFGNLTASI